jgi:hypothetical protein
MNTRQWMESVNYRITEGSEYCWSCYGVNAYCLDSWDGDHNGASASIVFDTKTQEVYESSVYDYSKNRAYRWINPVYKLAHKAEADSREVDFKTAWDNIDYTDLEVEEDFLQKLEAIMNYEDYDTRVQVPIEFDDDELLVLMKLAHERDITFNQFVEEALRTALVEFERDPESIKSRFKDFIDSRSI